MFTSQKCKHWYILHGWLCGFFSSGSGSNAAINLKKSLTLTAVYNAWSKYQTILQNTVFNQKNGNNRESKPNHPAHKLVSFRLTNDHFYIP
jgi:hypothetical protein